MADNKDVFNRTQVRASHIVLLVDPKAARGRQGEGPAEAPAIKAEIDGNKISFADAANKYSEDDGNKTSPSGGDLGYFTRRGQFHGSDLHRRRLRLEERRRSPTRSRPPSAIT